LAGVIVRGRPPTRPRARAAANPARVRSRINCRSNSANAPNRWNTNRPPAVVVSIASVTDRNPTPRSRSAVTVSIRCGRDRPNRSNRHTTNVSPGRSESNAATSSGRSSRLPDA